MVRLGMVAKAAIILFIFIVLQSYQILAFQVTSPFSQQMDTLTYRQWTLDDGLPVNSTNSVTQDSLGYLWVSTYDGLVRFDGLDFKTYDYSNTPEMPHNRATLLYLQKETGLWVALEYGGVLLYQQGTFKYYGLANGFTDSDISQIVEASDGRMFFVTNIGLFVYDGNRFKQFFTSDNKGQHIVNQVYEDTDGSIWLATNHGLVHVFNESGETREYDLNESERSNRFFTVHRKKDGSLIAGTDEGIYILEDRSLTTSAKYKALAGHSVQKIYTDEQYCLFLTLGSVFEETKNGIRELPGRKLSTEEYYFTFFRDSDHILWAITNEGSLSYIQDGKHQSFDAFKELNDLHVNDIYEDREKNLWLSTNTNGLISISKSSVRNLGEPEGLSGQNILALYEDQNGGYWVGTRGNGLNLIQDRKIKVFDVDNSSLASNIVHTIAEDSSGTLWIGHQSRGLDRYDPQKGFRNYRLGENNDINNVRALFTDPSGQIWAGTYLGLVKFDTDPDQQKVYGIQDGLSGQKVRYITQDHEGYLWIATLDGGISKFNGEQFVNFTTEDGLSSNNIRSIYIDEKEPGTVWIGSENNGLNRLRDGKIHYISTQDGLPDHVIHWITEDEHGWLWMSSNRGIFKIQKAELNRYLDGKGENFTLMHYGRAEGMRSPEGNGSVQATGMYTRQGKLWFATQAGVAIFDPSTSQNATVPPKIMIQGVQIQVQDDDLQLSGNTIEIPRGYQSFEVFYHAITFPNPEKTRFKYRLRGYDSDWQDVTFERSASYVNLPPGTYTMEVLAANNDGTWTEQPATASITILPLYYQQVWFYILCLLLLAGLIYTSTQFRYRYLIRQQEKLEKIIDEQTTLIREEKKLIQEQSAELEASNKTKDKFFSIIAHDLRNPFQAILGFSELLLIEADTISKEKLKEQLSHINDAASSLLTLVENLLNWASLNTGKISPIPRSLNLRDLLLETVKLFETVAQQKEIQLTVKARDEIHTSADPEMMKVVMRNLLSNALKFTPEEGEVSCTLRKESGNILLEIKDSGIGMDEDTISHILNNEVHRSRTGTNREKGTGLGLMISKEMIEMHKGVLSIKSKPDEGTLFIVTLPAEGLPEGD